MNWLFLLCLYLFHILYRLKHIPLEFGKYGELFFRWYFIVSSTHTHTFWAIIMTAQFHRLRKWDSIQHKTILTENWNKQHDCLLELAWLNRYLFLIEYKHLWYCCYDYWRFSPVDCFFLSPSSHFSYHFENFDFFLSIISDIFCLYIFMTHYSTHCQSNKIV